ncbi:DUF4893 domain-containing protein [Sphingomonas sp. ASV193]|uniref:DUF4893 domain-containing protein n=1 Tax=Sphingomonas sp. ASV193 TaxID=3144405 RepID=UPI0032E9005C
MRRDFASPSIALPSIVLIAALVAGCQTTPKPVAHPVVVAPRTKADAWMSVASVADQNRLARIGMAWSEGLAEARKTQAGRDIVRDEGILLKPLAGLQRPAPTPGSYNCKLVTLGRDKLKSPVAERFKPFFCYVNLEGDLFTIVKQTGSQRPAGRLWEDDTPTRYVFLGTLALGDESEARAYGDDPKRDMAGIFERIGPFRWRLTIPYPQDGAKLDVFDMTPVADQPKD